MPTKLVMSSKMKLYYKQIESEVDRCYKIAEQARAKGLDPEPFPEIPKALDVASRVEQLIGPPGIDVRIRELCEQKDREPAAFQIAREICAPESLATYESREECALQAVRTALGILTEGITAAPIEGVENLKIKRNKDGSQYLALYYSGPIRSAGGTTTALTVVLGDIVRMELELSPYKPLNDEIERFVEEINMRKVNLQYPSSMKEIRFAAKNVPIEINGKPTKDNEVTGYRNLERIETNKIRGGALLVLNDGICGKAHKLVKITQENKIDGWDWLEVLKSGKLRGSSKEKDAIGKMAVAPKLKYLEGIVAGRPVFAYPSKPGGFRLRYGRCRNTGFAAVGLNPITMLVGTRSFIVSGTQLIIERPGKGSVVLPVDTIEGPVVKLKDGSVIRVRSIDQAREIADDVDEILFLGDILIGFGEFLENNHVAIPSGYCEEWWAEELSLNLEKANKKEKQELFSHIPERRVKYFRDKPWQFKPTPAEAFLICSVLNIPLHPSYTYHWNEIENEELFVLLEALQRHHLEKKGEKNYLRIENSPQVKQVLESLGIPHRVRNGSLYFSSITSEVLLRLFSLEKSDLDIEVIKSKTNIMDAIQEITGRKIRPKAFYYIGGRMGRPEKSKERRMKTPVNVLFPIEDAGGNQRDIIKAIDKNNIAQVDLVNKKCPTCGKQTYYNMCPKCHKRTEVVTVCSNCLNEIRGDKCPSCSSSFLKTYSSRKISFNQILPKHLKKLKVQRPRLIKCVKGLINENKIPELLEKGILRARNKLFVYKDGTIRFDATDAPLTHFTPREIGVPITRLNELGYFEDYHQEQLKDIDQIIELKPQDILISKQGQEYMRRVANFIDELLEKIYGLPRFYNMQSGQDLVGHLVLGLAPHISAGIVGRIIGFTKAKVGYAHPYFHAAKRRNCDSDEDGIMLLLDALINFSMHYLPPSRGGMMDAPLILNLIAKPEEIDDEVYNLEVHERFPLEFFEKTLSYPPAKELLPYVNIVEQRKGTIEQYEGFKFTHHVSNINIGPMDTQYSQIKKVPDKIKHQLSLARMIRAVDASDVSSRVINTHFIPDILGNLRTFGTQKFRCKKCNTSYRRIPVSGRCDTVKNGVRCDGDILLTVYQGSISKYLTIARTLAEKYGLKKYLLQRISLVEDYLNSIFQDDRSRRTQSRIDIFLGNE